MGCEDEGQEQEEACVLGKPLLKKDIILLTIDEEKKEGQLEKFKDIMDGKREELLLFNTRQYREGGGRGD